MKRYMVSHKTRPLSFLHIVIFPIVQDRNGGNFLKAHDLIFAKILLINLISSSALIPTWRSQKPNALSSVKKSVIGEVFLLSCFQAILYPG